MPNAMSRATSDFVYSNVDCSLADGYAIISSADGGPQNFNLRGSANVHAISVGAIARGIYMNTNYTEFSTI